MSLFKTGLKLLGALYVVWWIYTLFSTVLPLLSMNIGDINLTILHLFGVIFFFVIGLLLFFYIVVILIVDWVFK